MTELLTRSCGECGRENGEETLCCSLCGALLPRRRAPRRKDPTGGATGGLEAAPKVVGVRSELPRPAAVRLSLPASWRPLLAGALLAHLFALPVLSYMGWFLASLAHECGHALAGWLCGLPSFPAIRLDGHAAAVHGERSSLLAIAMPLVLAAVAGKLRAAGRPRAALLALAGAVLLPFVSFTGAREFFFLAMGHGGELLFAGIAIDRAREDGTDHGLVERLLYGTVGAYLLWRNFILFLGLVTSTEALIAYYGSGSFGMQNDLVRVANDLFEWPLERVASLFLVATIATPVVALLLRRLVPRA